MNDKQSKDGGIAMLRDIAKQHAAKGDAMTAGFAGIIADGAEMQLKAEVQSLNVVAGDPPMLNTLAVNTTPWNICPVCKNQADVDDDASDGSQIRCHECKADLVVVEFGNPDGIGSTWELHVADEKEGVERTDAPVVNQPLTATPDLVARLMRAHHRALCRALNPQVTDQDIADGYDSADDDDLRISGAGIRAVIAELAAMGGEALPSHAQIARVCYQRGAVVGVGDRQAVGITALLESTTAPVLAAKDATIAEQTKALEWWRKNANESHKSYCSSCGRWEPICSKLGCDDAENRFARVISERDAARADIADYQDRQVRDADTLLEAEGDRDAALAEVERLTAEAETTTRHMRILKIAPDAARYANKCGFGFGAPEEALSVISRNTVDSSQPEHHTVEWQRAVLEYAAREGLT